MDNPVYIFDADGVFNSLTTHESDLRVIEQVANLLNKGCYVAINTGRGYPWLKEGIVASICKHVTPGKLEQLFISAEMGGVTVRFVDGNERHEHTAFSILPEQIAQAKRVFDDHAESKNIAWYEGKVSMATITKPAGIDIASFGAEAKPIGTILRNLFANDHIKVSINPDAIDIMTPESGKWAGAQLIHDWLQSTPAAKVKHFICFGDNASDYEMARFFGQQGHTVEFVFTGETLGEVAHDPQVKFTRTDAPYSEGTYQFLL